MKINEIKNLYNKKDKMHNWEHILRIRKNVLILKKNCNNIDEDLLNFLVKFHGLKNYVVKNKTKFSKVYITSLLRHNKNPKRIEEKIVFDANLLDNVGLNGIKKAINFGRMIGRSEKETFDYLRENIKKVKFYTKIGKKEGRKQIKIMKKALR